MTRTSLRLVAAIVPLLAACGGAENQVTVLSSAARSEGTLHQFCPGQEIPVWTGAGNPVSATRAGTLVLGSDTATFTAAAGFTLAPTALHLQFSDAVAGFPMTDVGNPIPGQFACQYAITPVQGQTVYTFDLTGCPLAASGDGAVFAAAHFGLEQPGGVGSVGSFYLPTSPVSVVPTHDGIEAIAYFPSIVVSGAGTLDGTYAGWCADPNRWIQSGPAMLYSTYDPAAMAQVAALLDPPTTFSVDKLPIANYIVNRYVAGTTVITPFDTSCNPIPDMPNGIVNMWSIQQALWYFLTGRPLEDADSHAMSIICDATANGAAFVPACNQVVLILGLPVDAQGVGQSLLIQMPVPCGGGSATAWADGLDGRLFPGARQWGTYFEYELSCAP